MPDRRGWRGLIASLLCADLLCLAAATMLGRALHGAAQSASSHSAMIIIGIVCVAGTIVLAAHRAYDRRLVFDVPAQAAAVLKTCVYGFAITSAADLLGHLRESRGTVVAAWMVAAVLLLGVRAAVCAAGALLHRSGHLLRRAVIVGADAQAISVARQLALPASGMRVVGFLDEYRPLGMHLMPGAPILGRPAQLTSIATAHRVDDAIVMPQALSWESLQRLGWDSSAATSRLRLHLAPGLYDVLTAGVHFTERNHVPLLSVNGARLSRTEAAAKRAFDCVVGSLLLVVFAPVMALMAVWQRAHGTSTLMVRIPARARNGSPFTVVRFASAAPFHSDFFEKLPGLLRVVSGRMSLVGPRPSATVTACGGLKPGLTGAWRESDDPGAQAVADLCYIRAYSIWLDLQVLFRRLRNRVRGRVSAPPLVLAAEQQVQS